MNKEIEVKVRVSNLDTIRTKLQKIGTFQKKVYQKDVYFVPPGNDFFAQDPVVEFLRIRHQKGKNQLAYHTAGDKGKESEHTKEYEVYINDTETMAQILTSLKFERRFVVEKKREYFQCGEFEIVLDEVKELGSFVEVEVINSSKNANYTKADCLNFLHQNSLVFQEVVHLSYPELVMRKERK